MGMWKGELSVLLSLYDVKTGAVLTKISDKDVILSYDKYDMQWDIVVEKLFRRDVFKPFFTTVARLN